MSVAEQVSDQRAWDVSWKCSDCGIWFWLSYRASSELKRTKRPAICGDCRHPPIIIVTQVLLDWWSDRFTEPEVVEMAEALWGPRYLWNLK